MISVMIDTDIAIDYLRGKNKSKNSIIKLWKSDRAYLSVLSIYELYAGMKKNEQENTDFFINACNVEYVSKDIAKKGGEHYKYHRSRGTTLTSVDCLIYATALIKGYKILTNNSKHYPDKNIIISC